MSALNERDVVRVLSLAGMECGELDRHWRTPDIGDIATVVMMLRTQPGRDGYLLECVDDDGRTVWLATFPREALEPVEASS